MPFGSRFPFVARRIRARIRGQAGYKRSAVRGSRAGPLASVPMAEKWTTAKIPDQSGRLALVTGANSGIGLRAAAALAAEGAELLLGCRNTEKGERAREEIL